MKWLVIILPNGMIGSVLPQPPWVGGWPEDLEPKPLETAIVFGLHPSKIQQNHALVSEDIYNK